MRSLVLPTRWAVALAVAAAARRAARPRRAGRDPGGARRRLGDRLAGEASASCACAGAGPAPTTSGSRLLVLGAVLVLNELYSGRSVDWDNVDAPLQGPDDRVRALGSGRVHDRARGAARRRRRWPRSGVRGTSRTRASARAFRSVLWLAIIGFGLYTAGKAAYLSTTFADPRRRAEPDLPRAAALRRDGDGARAAPCPLCRPRRLGGIRRSTCSWRRRTTWTCASTPTRPAWPSSRARTGRTAGRPSTPRPSCSGCSLAALAVVAAVVFLRRRLALAIAVAAAVLALGWNVTGEVTAARGSTASRGPLMANLPQPPTWVDQRDRRRADALHRPEDRRRERPLAARVLEPLDQARLEPGRHRARPGADAHARPAQPATASSQATPGTATPSPRPASSSPGRSCARKGGWRLYGIDPPLRLRLLHARHLLRRLDRLQHGRQPRQRGLLALRRPGTRPGHDVRHGQPEGVVQRQGHARRA